MKQTSETVVFFGSGPVAARSLELLSEHTHIEMVITKPSTVNQMSFLEGVPVFCASTKAELDQIIDNHQPKSRLGILIDYGVMVSQHVIDYFPLGIINSHFSILPQWRGADPISFSILSGQPKTGVSLMVLTAGLDEGDIIAASEIDITNKETTPTLTEKLIDLSDQLLATILDDYIEGRIQPVDQVSSAQLIGVSSEISYSRKLTKADGEIDWNKTATVIEREIRAFIDWPKSHTTLGGISIIIKSANVLPNPTPGIPGSYEVTKKQLIINTGEGALQIERLQPAGKKEMPIEAFLAGYRLN